MNRGMNDETPAPRYRVVNWNMARSRRSDESWRHLLDVLQPDVALLQEAKAPPEGLVDRYGGQLLHYETDARRRCGAAVYVGTSGPLLREVSFPPQVGHYALAQVQLPNDALALALSVHAIDQRGVIPHLRRALAALRPLRAGHEFVFVGGDFNLSRNFDLSRKPPRPRWSEHSHTAFLEDVLAGTEGLVDCHRLFNTREQQTFFSARTECELQDDHLFVSPSLARFAIDCRALRWPTELRHLSDHAPLVTDFCFS